MNDFELRPIHEILLRGSDTLPVGLYHLQLATAEQLCRLHYSSGSVKAIKARLKTLCDEGYVQWSAVPTKYYKSPYYYTLGQKGVTYLERLGMDTQPSWRASKEVDKHGLFVSHTLELNDVLIAAALLNDERFYLARFEHERALKRKPHKVSWTSDFATHAFTIIPDAFLDFRQHGTKLQCPVILEHDRGTEEQAHFKRKIAAYVAYLKAEAYKEQFGVTQALVAFTTFRPEHRLEQMRHWTKQVLSGEPSDIVQRFTFARLSRPLSPLDAWLEPRWYSPTNTDPEPLLVA